MTKNEKVMLGIFIVWLVVCCTGAYISALKNPTSYVNTGIRAKSGCIENVLPGGGNMGDCE